MKEYIDISSLGSQEDETDNPMNDTSSKPLLIGSQDNNISLYPKEKEDQINEESEEEQNEGGEDTEEEQKNLNLNRRKSSNEDEDEWNKKSENEEDNNQSPKSKEKEPVNSLQNLDESEYTLESEEEESDGDGKKEDYKDDRLIIKSPFSKSLFSNNHKREVSSSSEEEPQGFDRSKNFDTELYSSCVIEDLEDLERVRFILTRFCEKLLCNVLNQLFNEEEYDLCFILMRYYKVILSEGLFSRALETLNFKFLKEVWRFDRNRFYADVDGQVNSFTFVELLTSLKVQCENDKEEYLTHLQTLCSWRIKTKDNFLRALLDHEHDQLAMKHMGHFIQDMNAELIEYCLKNNKEAFLNAGLKVLAFNKFFFKEDRVTNTLLELLKGGTNTIYYLNVLTMIDISLWKTSKLKELLTILESYGTEGFEKNQILLTYNPLMTIALSCEILTSIKENRKKMENQANQAKKNLLSLGQMYTSKIEDEEFYESLVTDEDIRGRSLLKIITDFDFEPLMDEDDPKAESIMISIYQGKETTECDGNIKGYSSIYHILTTKPRVLIGDKFRWTDFLKNWFKPIYNSNYRFQYRYRCHSINYIFWKEFVCALFLLSIFQYINYEYLSLFNISELEGMDEDTKIKTLEDNLETYQNYNIFAFIFSFSLIAHTILKITFNAFSTTGLLPLDKWTLIDLASALLYIISIFVVSNLSPEDYLDSDKKDWIDYFILLVLGVTWLRFFSLFLVIRDISKLLLTLLAMITDTIAFIIIVACFLVIASSVFTTLYQDQNEEKYKNLRTSFRTLFDTAIAVYDYDGMDSRNLSHSILLIIIAFSTNVLLLNFIIAILSTTYENMKESGVFRYKSNLFKYSSKYLIAFKSEYQELILQPAPFTYLTFFLIPLIPWKDRFAKIGRVFSYIVYWVENSIFLTIFFCIEMLFAPCVYFKMFYHFFYTPQAILFKIMNIMVWIICGLFVSIALVLYDFAILFKLLMMTEGIGKNEALDLIGKADEEKEMMIFNQLWDILRQLYYDTRDDLNDGITPILAKEVSPSRPTLLNINSKTLLSLKKEKEKNYIKVGKEDTVQVEKFAFPMLAVLSEWRQQNYAKERGIQDSLHKRLKQISLTPRDSVPSQQNSAIKSLLRMVTEKRKQSDEDSDSKSEAHSNNSYGRGNGRDYKGAGEPNSPDRSNLTRSMSMIDDDNIDDLDVPEEDETIATEFLERFLLNDENSQYANINLVYFFKSLPQRLTKKTYRTCKFYNFKLFQESLVAYMNIQDVNAFEYNDVKNRDRMASVRTQILEQRQGLDNTQEFLKTLESCINQGGQKVSKEIKKEEKYQKEEQQKLMNTPPSNF